MVSSIIKYFVGTKDNPNEVHFWNNIYFHNPVYMYNGLNLTGNFYVNKDVPDSELANYETVLRSGGNTLYSVTENTLSAPTTNVYSNTLNLK